VDTPPAITGAISDVVACADLVVVPTRPSPHDLRAVGATVDIAEQHGKPVVFVINDATARARITGEAAYRAASKKEECEAVLAGGAPEGRKA
jgi:chromosome partitioning protein